MTYASDVLPVWDHALHLIKDYGYEYRDDPFRLSSGQLSHDYIDGKRAIAAGERLRVVSDAMIEHAKQQGMAFTHVGGLTMGADLLAGGIALMADAGWFSVRKEPKGHGLRKWIEGSELGPDDRVLLVDDVVTTGSSILKAYEKVSEVGAVVIGVIPMVDRGEVAWRAFADLGVPYAPLVTYDHLGIGPVGQG